MEKLGIISKPKLAFKRFIQAARKHWVHAALAILPLIGIIVWAFSDNDTIFLGGFAAILCIYAFYNTIFVDNVTNYIEELENERNDVKESKE